MRCARARPRGCSPHSQWVALFTWQRVSQADCDMRQTKLDYMSNIACFFVEFIGTTVLALVVLATTDKKNGGPPAGLLPVALFLALLGLAVGFGMQTCESPFPFSLQCVSVAHRACMCVHLT